MANIENDSSCSRSGPSAPTHAATTRSSSARPATRSQRRARPRRWRTSPAARGSASARCTATSPAASTCSRPSTSTRSRRSAAQRRTTRTSSRGGALSGWLHRFVGFATTKRALAEQLFEYIDRDSEVFRSCGDAVNAAGEPLLRRAQEAGVVRRDTNFTDVARMVGGISVIRTVDDEQIGRILEVALDGLRYRPEADG